MVTFTCMLTDNAIRNKANSMRHNIKPHGKVVRGNSM